MKSLDTNICLHAKHHDWAFFDTDTYEAAAHNRFSDGLQWVCEQSEPRPFRGHLTQLRIGRLYVTKEQTNQSLRYQGIEQTDSLMFYVAASARCNTHIRGQSAEPDALMALPGKSIEYGYISGPFDSVFVTIDEASLGSFSQRLTGCRRPLDFLRNGRAICEPGRVESFRRTVQGVLSELVADPRAVENKGYRAEVSAKILQQLTESVYFSGPKVHELPPPSTRSYIVDKAIEFMDANLAESVSIADVCRVVRVSRRTLSYSFEEVVGVSPARYLLTARLRRVRRELLRLGDRRFIYCVAHSHGFSHMGRFANYYHQAFGELPSETCSHTKMAGMNRSFNGNHVNHACA